MNVTATLSPLVEAEAPTRSADLIAMVTENPQIVLTDPASYQAWKVMILAESAKAGADVSTSKARDVIRAAARKIASSKTAIEAAKLALTERARKQVDEVNATGRAIKAELEQIAADVRRPLTEWEAAEETRIADCKALTDAIKRGAVVTIDDNTETVAGRLDLIKSAEITEAQFGDQYQIAKILRVNAIEALEAAHARMLREEADRAELAKLRAADEARLAKEAEAAALAARAQQMADYIKQVGLGFIGGQTYPFPILLHELEKKIVIDASYGDRQASLEALRVETLARVTEAFDKHMAAATERAEREAADKAREEAAKEANEKAAAKERQHSDALAAEKARADKLEADRTAEIEAAAKAKADADAETKRLADEQAKREANVAHRTKIKTAVKTAIMGLGVGDTTARAIVQAIVAGEVPHTSITF